MSHSDSLVLVEQVKCGKVELVCVKSVIDEVTNTT